MKNLCLATGILHLWLTNKARNPDMDALWNFTDMSKHDWLGGIYGYTNCYYLVDIEQRRERERRERERRERERRERMRKLFQVRRP